MSAISTPSNDDSSGDPGEFGSSNFIVKNGDGVFVELSRLESSSQFLLFAERVFSAGFHFTGLAYAVFLELLVDYSPEKLQDTLLQLRSKGRTTALRFSSDIQIFPEERRSLYRSPRIVSGDAEYLFEPVMIERTVEEPLLAENEAGEMEISGTEKRTISEKCTLSFDEFVAAMWTCGIRYGIDAEAVKAMIASGKSGRLVFARPLPPRSGLDSSLKEQSDRLYRDNSPRELPNGKLDLRQFRNRFPQIRKGERLLMKSPRVPGMPGRDIGARPIEPPVPQDFDLEQLAGPGTHVERAHDGEFIVSSVDGFLNLDTQTNRIAVTEKIVNYGGVSMKTTGDLMLDGDHFEEHGDIQEKRMVEGKSITVLGDVFGAVVSTGGTIHLMKNLMGGSATNHEGDILVEGLASNASIQARCGTITLNRAENSLISGKRVVIKQAINCLILGESVEIDASEGSGIAGNTLSIRSASPKKENQTIASVLLPDLSGFEARAAQIGKRIEEIESGIGALREKAESMAKQTEVRNYILISGKLQRKEITLSEEQKVNWQKLGVKVAPSLKILSSVNAEIQALQGERENLLEEALALEEEEVESTRGIACSIENISGETVVRKRRNAPSLFELHPRELRMALRDPGLPEERIPQSGSLDWKFS